LEIVIRAWPLLVKHSRSIIVGMARKAVAANAESEKGRCLNQNGPGSAIE
jgi:hypothetical protein